MTAAIAAGKEELKPPPQNNPIGRLLPVLRALEQLPDTQDSLIDVLGSVLRISDDDRTLRANKTTVAVLAIQAQLSLAEQILREKQVLSELYTGSLGRMANTFSVTNLAVQWRGQRGNVLVPEVFAELRWASFFIGDQEETIASEELSALDEDLRSLRETVAQSTDLSQPLRDFVLSQLNVISEAIASYTIAGVTPIRTALERVAGSIVMGRETLKQAADTPEGSQQRTVLSKTFEFIRKTGVVADAVDKTGKAIHTIDGAIEWVRQLLLPLP